LFSRRSVSRPEVTFLREAGSKPQKPLDASGVLRCPRRQDKLIVGRERGVKNLKRSYEREAVPGGRGRGGSPTYLTSRNK